MAQRQRCILLLWILAAFPALVYATPPFYGTTSIDPHIILPTDPSTYQTMSYISQQTRILYDRRIGTALEIPDVHNHVASFQDSHDVEFRVHPEFEAPETAQRFAERYAYAIGQLPAVLRKNLRLVSILQGIKPFGGDEHRGELLIHTGQARLYENERILEETLMHEACHISLDVVHPHTADWRAAQRSDGEFISIYARDYPTREDVAESFLPYYAVRYRPDRISDEIRQTIETTIPHRIAYFDAHIPLSPAP